MPIAIYALALAAFAIGTAEFIISGILPPLAADLSVTIPTAGLLVTAYAIGVAIGGPVLSLLTARLPLKPVMLVIMVVFAVSQVLCAFAPDYGMLLAARILSSAVHGTFFGAGGVIVTRLVPVLQRGAAVSLVIGGITVANLLGLPGGTAIGVAFGWRATFLAVAALSLVAVAALVWKLPRLPGAEPLTAGFRQQVRALRHHQVWLSYLTIITVMVGVIAFATYQVPMMIRITKVDPEMVPLFLLLGGVGSVLGIYAGGQAADWKAMPSLTVVLVLQSVSFFALAAFSLYDPVYLAPNLFLGGVLGFAFSTPLQARVMHAAREAPNLASSLIATAFNIGIAIGAFLGAVLLNAGVSLGDLPAVGSVTALIAAGLAGLGWALDRRDARQAAAA